MSHVRNRSNADRFDAGHDRLASALVTVLDALPRAVILLDDELRVVVMNAAARRLASIGSVKVVDMQLVFEESAVNSNMAAACVSVLESGQPVLFRGGGLEARVAPVAPGSLAVFIHDRRARSRDLCEHVLHTLYGLTATEAVVTQHLIRGAGPAEIARALSISTHTVRTHLRSIFAKTETRGQADLMRLLTTGVAALLFESDEKYLK